MAFGFEVGQIAIDLPARDPKLLSEFIDRQTARRQGSHHPIQSVCLTILFRASASFMDDGG